MNFKYFTKQTFITVLKFRKLEFLCWNFCKSNSCFYNNKVFKLKNWINSKQDKTSFNHSKFQCIWYFAGQCTCTYRHCTHFLQRPGKSNKLKKSRTKDALLVLSKYFLFQQNINFWVWKYTLKQWIVHPKLSFLPYMNSLYREKTV